MTDTTQAPLPSLTTLGQYIKDLSFENPNAPASLGPRENGPNISISVNVNAKQAAESDFEVELTLEGKALDGSQILFQFELVFAGVFRLQNIPAENFLSQDRLLLTRCAAVAFRLFSLIRLIFQHYIVNALLKWSRRERLDCLRISFLPNVIVPNNC